MGLLTSIRTETNASAVSSHYINIKFQFTCIFGLLVLMAGINYNAVYYEYLDLHLQYKKRMLAIDNHTCDQ